jgi:hypothetical protein
MVSIRIDDIIKRWKRGELTAEEATILACERLYGSQSVAESGGEKSAEERHTEILAHLSRHGLWGVLLDSEKRPNKGRGRDKIR